ncbi:hypothetical protein [Coleofasciculus sp. F4-SAH-05]|uniref:hypothetical protein n=1 Tax=Coleofasciculus sp. F4-SAH-05 TaxID=3069525 RepID=UPI0032FF640E
MICYSSFVIRHSSFVIRHSSFVIRHLSFVIRHSSETLDTPPALNRNLANSTDNCRGG